MALPAVVSAADLEVSIKNIGTSEGEIGIALFSSAEGFPMNDGKAVIVWLPAKTQGLVYSFEGIAPGTYAVSVAQDFNGNRKTDTNWVGIPKEPWGVSNNVRPNLRAPKFEEAAVSVTAAGPNRITIFVRR